MQSYRSAGFTLIEVMITVAIVAILSMVALPSYRDYVRRTEATDATATLATGRARMEQYFQDNRNYGPTAGTACGPSVPTSKYFTYSCATSNSGANFTLTATGTPGGAGTHTYTVTDNGTRSTTFFKGAAQSGKACWLIKGSEC
ncbi:MAG: prepilin-type N-terminal cleavage/methylation domain-containing protein [Burkholderiaceae bacterium]|nr:prepilin-type N-terminal cleavage/methylation domain-containing protein [Burkholderiaceae bacterium]